MVKPLRIMKFGGTSVANASAISHSARIVAEAARESPVVVVVSAMAGVTNQLLAAAASAESGDRDHVAALLTDVREEHSVALRDLMRGEGAPSVLSRRLDELLAEANRLCEGTALLRELTPRALDAISGLGERLSAPLFAQALTEIGIHSQPIEATELIVTDAYHGAAEPDKDATRRNAQTRLRPLLNQQIVPVVTGFIGATPEGVLTTLGRGGSDYSATLLGAALDADDIIIWTDVDGVLTADPKLVPEARTIPEISYREAAELAYFGAKVLHPKTLRAIMHVKIPVWIRNTFAPERPGTKITPQGRSGSGGVKALTAISNAALISVGGPGIFGVPDVLGRTFSTTASARVNVLLISQSSSQNEICLVVSSADAKQTVDALRREFAQDLAHEVVDHVTLDPNVAIVAVVGENMRGIPGIAGRTFNALGRDNVNIIAIAQGSSESNISFVVTREAIRSALVAVHREFSLGSPASD